MSYVAYQTSDKRLLLEVKYPHSKRRLSPIEIVQDPNFYVNLENGQPVLKKKNKKNILLDITHKYYSMGLSGFDTCDFFYTFKGLIIVSVMFLILIVLSRNYTPFIKNLCYLE